VQIAQAFQNYFEKFLDMFERIGDILPRCYTYQHLFPHHERLLQAISAAYLDIIYFCVDAKKTFRKLKRWTTGNVLVPHLRKPTDACLGSSFDVGITMEQL